MTTPGEPPIDILAVAEMLLTSAEEAKNRAGPDEGLIKVIDHHNAFMDHIRARMMAREIEEAQG